MSMDLNLLMASLLMLHVQAADDLMVNLFLSLWEQRRSHLGLIVTSLPPKLYLR